MNNIQMYGKLKKLNESEFVVVLTYLNWTILSYNLNSLFMSCF